MSTNTPPLSIRDANAAPFIDLTILAEALQATPEPLYLFRNYVSTKYGPKSAGKGSKIQVDRLKPLASPDPDNLDAYIAGDTRNATPINSASDMQALDWGSVTIQVKRRRMPKPVAEKFETEQLSQVDIMMGHGISLRRNYNEFLDDFVREAYRSSVCTNIFGGSLRASIGAMQNNPTTDGLNVAMLKEYKRRAAALFLRAFGSQPGSDMQALTGSYLAVTDQVGINELSEDPLWRDYVIRDPSGEKGRLVKGYIGEYEQITVVKSDRMRTVSVGPSGSPFNGHEILFTASDPTLIDPGENGVQGFVGENPVVLAMVGLPEVKKANEDNFGEDLIYTWFQTCGVKALEELSSTDAALLTAKLGGNLDVSKGQCATNSSRFIHRGYFV